MTRRFLIVSGCLECSTVLFEMALKGTYLNRNTNRMTFFILIKSVCVCARVCSAVIFNVLATV